MCPREDLLSSLAKASPGVPPKIADGRDPGQGKTCLVVNRAGRYCSRLRGVPRRNLRPMESSERDAGCRFWMRGTRPSSCREPKAGGLPVLSAQAKFVMDEPFSCIPHPEPVAADPVPPSGENRRFRSFREVSGGFSARCSRNCLIHAAPCVQMSAGDLPGPRLPDPCRSSPSRERQNRGRPPQRPGPLPVGTGRRRTAQEGTVPMDQRRAMP